MEFLQTFIDYFLHLDDKLEVIIENYGTWTYAILFAIIFIETGLIIMPFLPGDSLLFAAGSVAAKSSEALNIQLLFITDKEGFEPPVFIKYICFQNKHYRPLSHLSNILII